MTCLDIFVEGSQAHLQLTQPKESGITALRILNSCGFKIETLHLTLSKIKALEHLTLETEVGWEGDTSPLDMEPCDLAEAISQHRHSLTELSIACSNSASYPDSSLFGSLRQYQHLRRLAIPISLLPYKASSLTLEDLPPHLEELQLQCGMGFSHDWDNDDRSARVLKLESVGEDMARLLPELKRVVRTNSTMALYSIKQHFQGN